MNNFMNALRQTSMMTTQSEARTRVGNVTSYDPNTYSAKVMLQPEGIETGWLPILTNWSGNGWGLFSPPTSGDMVHVEFRSADVDAGQIVGRFFNDQERPLPAPSGEFWLVHKSGSLLKFHNDGNVELVTEQDLRATVGRNANVTVANNATVSVGGTASYTATQHQFSGPVTMDSTLAVAGGAALNGGFSAKAGSGGGAAGTITGDMHATGTVTGDVDVVAAGKSGKSHTHRENGAGNNTNSPN